MNKRHVDTISVPKLYKIFPDQESCLAWLEKIRWNGEPVCPHCGGMDNVSDPPPSKPHHYWHKDCRKHFTATTGTALHSTKKPLQDWIYAMYSVLTARKGVSAMQLSKELGCAYRTAWYMLQRIREACSSGTFKMNQVVEVDETYVGGKERNKRKKTNARGTVGKTPVVGARERGGKVAAAPVKNTEASTLLEFIASHVEFGSTVYTDGATSYEAILPYLYRHSSVNHGQKEWARGEVSTNSIESVWALLKRAIYGTWHHVSVKHLGRYVNEVTFRLNDGNCQVDTLDRIASLAKGIGGRKLRYRDMVA